MFAKYRLIFSCLLMGLAANLGGCTPRNSYSPPAGLSPATAATLLGSRVANPDPLEGDMRVYVVKIDDKLTNGGPSGWDQPILLTPGAHRIDFGIAMGRSAWGFGLAVFQVEAGKQYTLRGSQPTATTGAESLFYGWLEGPDGQRMGDRIAVDVRPQSGGSGPVYIPIMIKSHR